MTGPKKREETITVFSLAYFCEIMSNIYKAHFSRLWIEFSLFL